MGWETNGEDLGDLGLSRVPSYRLDTDMWLNNPGRCRLSGHSIEQQRLLSGGPSHCGDTPHRGPSTWLKCVSVSRLLTCISLLFIFLWPPSSLVAPFPLPLKMTAGGLSSLKLGLEGQKSQDQGIPFSNFQRSPESRCSHSPLLLEAPGSLADSSRDLQPNK